jgi:hypothetical protein
VIAVLEVRVAEVDADVVEGIVRWYVEQGGTSGTERIVVESGLRRVDRALWGPRDQIGLILAECPYRAIAGDPFGGWFTVTPVERAIKAELEYTRLERIAARLQTWQGAVEWRETVLAMQDRDMARLLAQHYRGHPAWQPAMSWLVGEFELLVYGDPARGVRGDASFLPYVQGT